MIQRMAFICAILAMLCGCGGDNTPKKVDNLIRSNDFNEAIALLDKKITQNPHKYIYTALKAKVFAHAGKTEDAYREYQHYYRFSEKVEYELLRDIALCPLRGKTVGSYKFIALLCVADMAKIGNDVQKLVMQCLEDDDAAVRSVACLVAGRKKLQKAENRLMRLLNDEKPDVVWNAAWALGEIKAANACSKLIDILQSAKSPGVLSAALTALGKIRCKDSLPLLKHFYHNKSKKVAAAALAAAEYIEKGSMEETFNFLRSARDRDSVEAIYLLAGEYRQKQLMPKLVKILQSKNASGKAEIIKALSDMLDADYAKQIEPFANSSVYAERANAYFALVRLGVMNREIYKRGLTDKSFEIRRLSALGLGFFKDSRIKDMLHERMVKAQVADKVAIAFALSL